MSNKTKGMKTGDCIIADTALIDSSTGRVKIHIVPQLIVRKSTGSAKNI